MKLCHCDRGGRQLVDLLDAHANGKLQMELFHHYGIGRPLVHLLDAHANREPKIELCHHQEEVGCWST